MAHHNKILKNHVLIQTYGNVFSWDLYGLGIRIKLDCWKKIFNYFSSFDMNAYKLNKRCNLFSFGHGYSYINFNKEWFKENKEKIYKTMEKILSSSENFDIIEDYVVGWNDGENLWEQLPEERKTLLAKYQYWYLKKKENKGYNRYKIFERDNFKCRICGKGVPEVTLHIDHWIPKARGGLDVFENLVTLCSKCNISKNAHVPKIPIMEIIKDSCEREIEND